jgi:hypothetical protein
MCVTSVRLRKAEGEPQDWPCRVGGWARAKPVRLQHEWYGVSEGFAAPNYN